MKFRKTGKKEITFHDDRKKKDYVFIQPESNSIKIADEKAKGNKHEIDEWLAKLNEVGAAIDR